MTPLTRLSAYLDTLDERAAKATPGPWCKEDAEPELRMEMLGKIWLKGCVLTKADEDFILSARSDLPRLVRLARAMMKCLEKELEWLRTQSGDGDAMRFSQRLYLEAVLDAIDRELPNAELGSEKETT